MSCESIQLERQEKRAMEYDRELVTEADASDLDLDVVSRLAERIMPNTSPELFLQYLNLAEYSRQGLKLRRAALLLFGREVAKWHPRCQVRMIRVAGTSMGSGAHYEVEKDETRTAGILELIEGSWDMLRPRLAVTRMGSDSMFSETLLYPETACREALTNAIAHRDYSVQGRGIEIYIFDDRIEIVSPGKLMPTVRLQDLTALKGVHDSRNPYIARTLRESGYMRELGEGIPRIFRAMAEHDLVQPDLSESSDSFKIVLHSKSIFSEGDQAWLRTYSLFDISKDEQKVLLLGRDGKLMAPKEIMDMLKIVDTDEYRQVVESMQSKGLIYNALTTAQVTARRSRHKSRRDVPRYKVRSAPELRQFFDELLAVIAGETPTERVDGRCTQSIRRQLSAGSPYRVNVPWSLRYLGLAGSDGVPLPRMRRLWAAY